MPQKVGSSRKLKATPTIEGSQREMTRIRAKKLTFGFDDKQNASSPLMTKETSILRYEGPRESEEEQGKEQIPSEDIKKESHTFETTEELLEKKDAKIVELKDRIDKYNYMVALLQKKNRKLLKCQAKAGNIKSSTMVSLDKGKSVVTDVAEKYKKGK